MAARVFASHLVETLDSFHGLFVVLRAANQVKTTALEIKDSQIRQVDMAVLSPYSKAVVNH